MAKENNLSLARPLKAVKQLSSSVTLDNYYTYIKPFLFGTESTDLVDLQSVSAGVYAFTDNNGKLIPGKQILVQITDNKNSFTTIDITDDENIKKFQSKELSTNDYFLPSDFVSVLTTLAKIFHDGNTVGTTSYTYNKEGLTDYVASANAGGNLALVKDWADKFIPPKNHSETQVLAQQNFDDWFYEITPTNKNAAKVKVLLDAVVKAALEFEESNQSFNTDEFVPKSEISPLLIADLQQRIIANFNAYKEKVKEKIDTDEKFAEAATEIAKKISELLQENELDLLRSLFSSKNKEAFINNKIFSPQIETALWGTRISDKLAGISLSDEYSIFADAQTKAFLDKYEALLEKEYITPLLTQTTEGSAGGEAAETDNQTGEGALQNDDEEVSTDLISLEELQNEIETRLTSSVYTNFVETYIYADTNRRDLFEPQRNNFENQHLETLTQQLTTTISENQLRLQIDDQDLERLTTADLYSSGESGEGSFSKNILDSPWFKDFIQEKTNIISSLPSPNPQYQSYFEFLYQTYIVPALDDLYEDTPVEDQDPNDSQDALANTDPTQSQQEPRITTATVPTDIPTTQAGQATIVDGNISALSQEQLAKLHDESARIYSRAVYELFTMHGLSVSDLDPAFLAQMNAEVVEYISKMDQKSFSLLFASDSHREKALQAIYIKFNKGNKLQTYYEKLAKTPAWQNLTEKQKEGLAQTTNRIFENNKIFTTQELLQVSLNESLDFNDPVLTQNIQNTIDALIITKGINQTFYAYNQDTNQVIAYKTGSQSDVLSVIENMSVGELVLIFNLPPDPRFNDDKIIKLLKETLKKYAEDRASDLALHIKSTSLAEGFVHIGADLETVREHVKKYGAKTIIGGFDEKNTTVDDNGNLLKPASNRKEHIRKQYASFIPLWTHLTPQEQALIYKEMLGYVPKDSNQYETEGYPFIPEFIFFDLAKLDSIKRLAQANNLSQEEVQDFYELLALNEQLAQEESFANYLKELYEYQSQESELIELATFADVEVANLSRAASYREIVEYDQQIQAGGSTTYDPYENRSGLYPKVLNSKFGKKLKNRFGLKKKLSPAEKSKKALNSALSGALTKGVASASNFVIPGLGVALLAIPNKKIRDWVAKGLVGVVTLIISSTAYALTTIGGMLGFFVGGALGSIFAGAASGGVLLVPGAITGAVSGAYAGSFVLPQKWTNFSGNATSNPAFTNASSATLSSNSELSASATATAATVTVSLAAPVIAVAVPFFITIYIIIIIQSAFLIPVPQERASVAFDPNNPIGTIGLENCKDPSELSSKITRNSSSDLAGRAFDIVNKLKPGFWCYWNWNPDYDGLSQPTLNSPLDPSEFPDLLDEVELSQYPNHCVYRDGFPNGCGGDWKAMGGNALYWCTWLVNHTYQQNYSLAASIMASQFKTLPNHIFLPVETVTYNDIQPGDVIFTSTEGRNGNIGHVAVVHDVGPDYIRSVDSNASSRYHEYAVGDDGKVIVDSISYLGVVGFGRRL